MIVLHIIRDYFHWHYTTGVIDYLRVWGNFLHFILNLFSIKLLVSTLFTPWKRMEEEQKVNITDFYNYFEKHFINFISRIIGALIRSALILVGTVIWAIICVTGLVGFIAWFLLPIGIFILIFAGLELMLTS